MAVDEATMVQGTSTVNLRAVGLGLAGAAIVIFVLVSVVGFSAVVDAFRSARLWVLPLLVTAAFLWPFVWSLSLTVVLSLLGVSQTRLRTFGTYLGIVFANNVTPFAQVGAEPFAALIVSRATDSRFEVSLSAVASVDALNVLPSVGLVTISLVYFIFRATLNPRIELAAVIFIGLVVLVGALGILAWQRRVSLEESLQRVGLGVEQAIERTIGESERFGTPAVTERVDGSIRSLERIAREPRQLGVELAFSTVGWLCLVLSLWLALYAIGDVVPFEVVMFVVPLAIAASITPLPGGAGGIEATYIILLVALTPISVPAATAAVLLYRTSTYLLPVVAGGGAIVILGATKSEDNSVKSPELPERNPLPVSTRISQYVIDEKVTSIKSIKRSLGVCCSF